jgi:starvation-inducible outer membrane lipoprotein
MYRTLLIGAVALSLSGCVTTQAKIGSAMCDRKEALQTSLLLMIQNAAFIADPVVRQSVIGGAQAQLDALTLCPPAPS